jgi:hypothetical protein
MLRLRRGGGLRMAVRVLRRLNGVRYTVAIAVIAATTATTATLLAALPPEGMNPLCDAQQVTTSLAALDPGGTNNREGYQVTVVLKVTDSRYGPVVAVRRILQARLRRIRRLMWLLPRQRW